MSVETPLEVVEGVHEQVFVAISRWLKLYLAEFRPVEQLQGRHASLLLVLAAQLDALLMRRTVIVLPDDDCIPKTVAEPCPVAQNFR